jgi:hypothetical protein
MILRIFLALFFTLSLHATDDSWLSKVDTKLEIGIYFPSSTGTISNLTSTATFDNDFGYSQSEATYIAAEIKLHYAYLPNISLGYFNMQDNSNATLTRTIRVADSDFDGSVATQIDYQVFNLLLYKEFKIKGEMGSLFGKSIYSGDLEFDVGLNSKLFQWKYQVQDLSDVTRAPSWIEVNEFIPLPYFGIKYHWYDFKLYADISALAFSSAKSTSYQYGISYRVVSGLYLSAAYVSEEFEVVEDQDTIEFQTDGYKFSFMYAF